MPPTPDDYDFEERAAILEYDAGYSREEAERLAREMVKKGPATHDEPPGKGGMDYFEEV